MKFSLFFELQIANPTAAEEIAAFRCAVQQAQLADELGYDCIWAVEHHGLYEYAHSSAPEILLSYIAAKTRNIRLGHGCTLLPYRYNHPIRVAERVATLDILSNGRVNWGTAKSVTRVEQEAFEIDASALHEQWLESLQIIPRMWSSDVFCYSGTFFNIPPTHIIPKPLQRPHPPIFAACSSPDNAARVGALGIGALNLAIYHDEKLAERVGAYKAAIETAKPVGMAVNNRFSCTPAAMVLEDDWEACKVGYRGAQFFLQSLIHYHGKERPVGNTREVLTPPSDGDTQRFQANRNTAGSQLSSVIGDPQSARETVTRFADAGVDELIFVMQTGTTPHELVMESIRVMAEKVMPYFA